MDNNARVVMKQEIDACNIIRTTLTDNQSPSPQQQQQQYNQSYANQEMNRPVTCNHFQGLNNNWQLSSINSHNNNITYSSGLIGNQYFPNSIQYRKRLIPAVENLSLPPIRNNVWNFDEILNRFKESANLAQRNSYIMATNVMQTNPLPIIPKLSVEVPDQQTFANSPQLQDQKILINPKKRKSSSGSLETSSSTSTPGSPIISYGNPSRALKLSDDRRLVINFESYGTLGPKPQRYGKNNLFIPHGLIGTHIAYQEQWRVEIYHTTQQVLSLTRMREDIVCIQWTITNIASQCVYSVTETPDEAVSRANLGWTVTSKLFRDAMAHRADQLFMQANQEENPCRAANLRSLAKTLRPKSFTQGPLLFGLKHKVIHDTMERLRSEAAAAAAEAIDE